MEADRPLIEPYVVQAVDEWSESSIDIEGSSISTTFEVVSVRDRDLDNAIFPLYQFYGHELGYAVSLYYDLTKWMPISTTIDNAIFSLYYGLTKWMPV